VGAGIENESELIQTYLAPLASKVPGAFGLTDDAALLSIEPGTDLVVTNDPVIAGVHFFASDKPENIAWKALAVNVSDLAAKGADPRAYLLALAFPGPPERDWMAAFAQGLGAAHPRALNAARPSGLQRLGRHSLVVEDHHGALAADDALECHFAAPQTVEVAKRTLGVLQV